MSAPDNLQALATFPTLTRQQYDVLNIYADKLIEARKVIGDALGDIWDVLPPAERDAVGEQYGQVHDAVGAVIGQILKLQLNTTQAQAAAGVKRSAL